MIDTDFYIKQFNRRRDWEVIFPSPNQKIVEGAERTLRRALTLSQLELPVADLINSTLESHQDIPKPIQTLLRANAKDEIKHDQVLENLKTVFPTLPEDEKVMGQFKDRALELANTYSPLVVAGVLEASVFFVMLPMYRLLGGGGFRTIAGDISNDENVHVATNVTLAKDLGWDRGETLNQLRVDIVQWLLQDLAVNHENKYLSRTHWARASNNLYWQGKAPQLATTKRGVMPAFFEKSNADLPRYS